MFHIVAISCVVWSLYVLIEKTAEDLKSGEKGESLPLLCPAYVLFEFLTSLHESMLSVLWRSYRFFVLYCIEL